MLQKQAAVVLLETVKEQKENKMVETKPLVDSELACALTWMKVIMAPIAEIVLVTAVMAGRHDTVCKQSRSLEEWVMSEMVVGRINV